MGKQLRYLVIAQTIRNKIRQGVFPQGMCLPSQKDLAQTFNTSIMTIRGALAELTQEGIVHSVHGIGTFVASTGIHANAIGLQGFQNEMDHQKQSISNVILSLEHQISDQKLTTLYEDTSSTFSCLSRLRMIDHTPVILQRSYVKSCYSEIFASYQAPDSLYQFFTAKTGIMITQGKEIISPIILGPKELEILEVQPPATAFLSQRVSISLDNKVVLYDEAYLSGHYVVMASKKFGRSSVCKYIINKNGTLDAFDSFSDPDLWEDLV